MRKLTSKAEVQDLLDDLKRKIKTNGLIFLNSRPNNAQTLATLGITAQEQRRIIDSLTVEDYCGGPEEDHQYSWKTIILFGKAYRRAELYIKFSIGVGDAPVTCLSFHIAKNDMDYVFNST